MATNEVPGFDPKNADELHMGCWAEHKDGSLIRVESTEGARVIFSIFDMSTEPPVEYRDAMPEDEFKERFSWDEDSDDDLANVKWTWHDKTPFPWDKLIADGAKPGPRHVSADHHLSEAAKIVASRERREAENAAQRVARHLKLKGQKADRERVEEQRPRMSARIAGWARGLADRIESLGR